MARRRHGSTIVLMAAAALVIAAHLGLGGAVLAGWQWTGWAAGIVLVVILGKVIVLAWLTIRHRKTAADGDDGLIRRARLYEAFATVGFGGQRRRVFDGLVALSGAQPGDYVLDVGCGTGYLTRRVARAVAPDGHVAGVDPSSPVLDYARRTAPSNCSFFLAGAEELPQPDASCDVVVSSLAVHHLPPANRPLALREMLRVLRPGGRLLIADFRPPRNKAASYMIGLLCGHVMQRNPVQQLASLASDAGFQLTGSGDRRPCLHYIQAQRPADGGVA